MFRFQAVRSLLLRDCDFCGKRPHFVAQAMVDRDWISPRLDGVLECNRAKSLTFGRNNRHYLSSGTGSTTP